MWCDSTKTCDNPQPKQQMSATTNTRFMSLIKTIFKTLSPNSSALPLAPNSIVMAPNSCASILQCFPKQYCDGNTPQTVLRWQPQTVLRWQLTQTVQWWQLTPNCAQIGCERLQGRQSSSHPAASGNAGVETEGCPWFSPAAGGIPCDHALGHWTPVGKKITDEYGHSRLHLQTVGTGPSPIYQRYGDAAGARALAHKLKPSSWPSMVSTGISDQIICYTLLAF